MALKNNSTDIKVNLTMALKNNSTGSSPDWLLYVVPSIAFVVGLILFSQIYRTQRRREKALQRVAALKNIMSTTSAGHTYTRYTRQGPLGAENKDSSKLQNSSGTKGNLKKQEAQSYENVTTIIYSNDDNVNYCVRKDEDYITPDAGEVTETEKSIYLQPLQNLTETDYINPDGENKQNLEHTDTESYENMDSLACPKTNTHTGEEGWYECMDRRQIQS
ncbi:uncharacterized protein LOC113650546 isoform X4 [Tachysurus fulvidraco]|uniref:uncharacterized protein LOC113650546 isoform X4 n=1 Tax=Tachysurus fulvidraco TaxID=1234273 RepID=UPI000F4E55C4|nr:uncharacterized protein LOC113650546 isoform X4 [Tachysurus fulvidraco]